MTMDLSKCDNICAALKYFFMGANLYVTVKHNGKLLYGKFPYSIFFSGVTKLQRTEITNLLKSTKTEHRISKQYAPYYGRNKRSDLEYQTIYFDKIAFLEQALTTKTLVTKINEVMVTENSVVKKLKTNTEVEYVKKIPHEDFPYKVMFGSAIDQSAVDQVRTTMIELLAEDEIFVSTSLRRHLGLNDSNVSRYKSKIYVYGNYFWVKDPINISTLSIVSPGMIKKIIKLEKINDQPTTI